MIIDGGLIFIRRCDQLPQVTIRRSRIVMEVGEPPSMEEFNEFLKGHVAGGSLVTGCTFYSLHHWATTEARQRLGMVQSDARRDAPAGGIQPRPSLVRRIVSAARRVMS